MTEPDRDPARPWLVLLDDEVSPRVVDVEEPMPDPSLLGHLRKRLNELINANLRSTFGQ